MTDPTLKRWNTLLKGQPLDWSVAAVELITAYSQGKLPTAMSGSNSAATIRSTWQMSNAAVERYNAPGRFTAFIGYEYTSLPVPRQHQWHIFEVVN